MENPIETPATEPDETTIQYINEEINETINEVTRQTDQSVELENEFIKLHLAIGDFLESINPSIDSDEKLDYANLLQKIIDKYGYDDGVILIFEFIYNNQIIDDTTIQIFLDEIKVACVPGEAFGAPGYIRFSFALSDEDAKEGLTRIAELCETATF